jgi:pimeloyl-ACP methyl ester carboxylesterase
MPEAATPRTSIVIGSAGVKLSVRSYAGPSKTSPGLLLHHGLASSQHIWDLMIARLTSRFRVVTFDARGHGRSGKPDRGYGFDHVVGDALDVIRATRMGRPLMGGHSWGAMVALELAARHPRRITGAVLVDGGIDRMSDSLDWQTAKRELAPPHLAGMPVEEFRALIRTFSADAVEVTPEVEDIVLSVMRIRPDGTIAPYLSRANHLRILRAIWEQDPLELYPRLRVPVLAVVASGSNDPAQRGSQERKRASAEAVRHAATRVPVRITWIEGIHDVPLQHPDRLARRIERFAAGVVG